MARPRFPLPYPADTSATFTCIKGCHIRSAVDVYQVTVEGIEAEPTLLWPLCRAHYEEAMRAFDETPVPEHADTDTGRGQ
jgi:hypothetical protein